MTARVLRSPTHGPPAEADAAARPPSTVFGPTCDGIDLIFKDVPMPLLRRGDWLQFPNFGAYTIAGACAFNGLPVDQPEKFYVWSERPVGAWEQGVAVLRKGAAPGSAEMQAQEQHLCFVADLHDLESVC